MSLLGSKCLNIGVTAANRLIPPTEPQYPADLPCVTEHGPDSRTCSAHTISNTPNNPTSADRPYAHFRRDAAGVGPSEATHNALRPTRTRCRIRRRRPTTPHPSRQRRRMTPNGDYRLGLTVGPSDRYCRPDRDLSCLTFVIIEQRSASRWRHISPDTSARLQRSSSRISGAFASALGVGSGLMAIR